MKITLLSPSFCAHCQRQPVLLLQVQGLQLSSFIDHARPGALAHLLAAGYFANGFTGYMDQRTCFVLAFLSLGLGMLQELEWLRQASPAGLDGRLPTLRRERLVTAAKAAMLLVLGAATVYASRLSLHGWLSPRFYPWAGVVCGLAIFATGGILLLRRITGQSGQHLHVGAQRHRHFLSPLARVFMAWKSPSAAGERRPPAAPEAKRTRPNRTRPWFRRSSLPVPSLSAFPEAGRRPGALVVLLSALSTGSAGRGVLLIACYCAGLLAVRAGAGLLPGPSHHSRLKGGLPTPLVQLLLGTGSPVLMLAVGCTISIRALAATGLTLHSFSQQKLGPALFVAGLGLVLGIRHSTDADHVVAISTIVSRQRSLRTAIMIGALWGLGHTLTIFAVGCLIILGGVAIPTRIGLSMEFSVALMLILLGVLNLTGVMQKLVARLTPGRSDLRDRFTLDDQEPVERDALIAPTRAYPKQRGLADAVRRHGAYQLFRPLAIGLVHGLAGSAAIALLVLSTIHNPLWAVGYLVIFGVGTLLGMMAMTAAMSLPLVYAGDRLPRLSRFLGVASGLVSVCFGMFLVYQLGYLGGLFTSHPRWTPQ